MSEKQSPRARRRALQKKKRQRRQLAVAAAALAVLCLGVALALLLRRPPRDAAIPQPSVSAEVPAAEATAVPEESAEAAEEAEPAEVPAEAPVPEATPETMLETTPEPTTEPTPEPTPEATPVPRPDGIPDVVSFYTPQGANYSPRVRMGESYTGPWKKGKDIGSFEVIASDEDFLDGSFFGDIFGAAWTAFPNADKCKIGYTLRYTLDDGSEVKYTMLSPAHIEHTEYIEVWLYDDYHRQPHKFYSHLKPSSMKKPSTLMTSIKLTAGDRIAHVTDIWLSAFICTSLDDFDADRNYIGPTGCEIHILKK